ncbi:cytochrome P450 2D19 [Xenopus laevis]|uniref:Uncharacterized protein n=2 Tax=Xenopus laevis TaxID=8355 RepID=A0A974D2E6_XENLA|nr:cytochrome P450 2D19 [Xenopus laevis]OCT83136.1 hypothetical protein XELAEV_18025675mg [Xenopus laevis]
MSLLSQLCSFAFGCNVFTLGIICTLCLLLLDYMKRRKPCRNFPPSPPSWPFMGNILQLDFSSLHNNYKELAKQYGDVFSLKFFWQNVVVLNGYEAIKEALLQKSEDFADRPPFALYESIGFNGNNKAIVLANYGKGWKDVRRFTLSTLRDFGMGKKSLEEKVREEAGYLCAAFQSEQGHLFEPHYKLNTAVGNVICSIMFGDRFDYDDFMFQKLVNLIQEILQAESGTMAQFTTTFPWLTKLPGLTKLVFRPQIDMLEYLQKIISEHQQTWDPACTRDFIDAFMLEIEKAKGDKDSHFNEKNLLLTTFDLFTAGSETTTTTLRWGLLYMLQYPDVQRKAQEEIDQVIGRSRKPTMADVLQMPYMNAVIHEIQRCADIVPLSVPHMTYRNTEVKGFSIPKGVVVFPILSSVLKDEKIWEKPFQFYPEHFLDSDGKFVRREAFLPFSAGRRVCPGEQLARMELFLFFTSLLQRFSFQIPDGHPCPQDDPLVFGLQSPHPYKLCAKIR